MENKNNSCSSSVKAFAVRALNAYFSGSPTCPIFETRHEFTWEKTKVKHIHYRGYDYEVRQLLTPNENTAGFKLFSLVETKAGGIVKKKPILTMDATGSHRVYYDTTGAIENEVTLE